VARQFRRRGPVDLAQPAARVLHEALFTWKLEAVDVSRMAGHANVLITLEMYFGWGPAIRSHARPLKATAVNAIAGFKRVKA
jgi:hypothetical protein